MSNRDLLILRIDDHLKDAPRTGFIISGWREAQAFWNKRPIECPDIVLCDINFDTDTASPLHHVGDLKPTGLLYAIPFLAAAAMREKPLVVSFHTGDASLFAQEPTQQAEAHVRRPERSMVYLAAELVGLVSAMTEGEPAPKIRDTVACWKWLSERRAAAPSVAAAEESAIQAYRRALVGRCGSLKSIPGDMIVVDPLWYAQLVGWCERVSQRDAVDSKVWETDPGLKIILHDGSRDHISIRSMFSTCRPDSFVPSAFEVEIAQREGSSVAAKLVKYAWELSGEPRIGAFVGALSDWSTIYERVGTELESKFPCDGGIAQNTLAEVFPEGNGAWPLLRLVALVFQLVRLHKSARDHWSEDYVNSPWDFRTLRFSECGNSRTLKNLLKCIYETIKAENVEFLTIGDLQDTLHDGVEARTWSVKEIELYVSMLIEMKLLDYRLGSSTELEIGPERRGIWGTLPPIPTELKPKQLKTPINALAVSFGASPKGASNVVQRIGAYAFYPVGSQKDGTRFINNLIAGVCPGWLRELAIVYAENWLAWDVRTASEGHFIPNFLRQR